MLMIQFHHWCKLHRRNW